jgi:hypothetical protein
MPGKVDTPQPQQPTATWEHIALYQEIQKILAELPDHFESVISVSGVNVTEIYTFGSVLGSTIEQEVIRTLNGLRGRWDADNHYARFQFLRQPQTFPDVLLVDPDNTNDVLFGIELKSWYLLAKEAEPSFRYQVTPAACADADLLVIIPWVLSNVLSGSPIIFNPYIAPARYIAEYRNFWWQSVRQTSDATAIRSPDNVTPYPQGRDKIVDHPVADSGNNFGRIARTRLMDDYVDSFRDDLLLGVTVDSWRKFLKSQKA